MHARLNVASNVFKRFLPHSNRLKYLVSLITGLSATEGSSCSVSSIAYFSSFMFFWTLYYLLYSVELSSIITLYDSPSSVEQTCVNFLSSSIYFDSLLSVEKMCEIGIWIKKVHNEGDN